MLKKKKAKKKQEGPMMTDPQRACQIWSVLVFAAGKSQTITYKELSRITGLTGTMSGPLGYIQELCLMEELPPLTALVVREGGLPSQGFYAVAPDDIHKAQQLVFGHDWNKEPEKTPIVRTYKGVRKEWNGLSAKKQGEYVQACCEMVQIKTPPGNTHAKRCPKCRKAGRKR